MDRKLGNQMEIQFLGTGAGVPAKFRNVTSIALKLLDESNEVWLFDVGEGTQQQILKTHLRPRKITKIFITHLHGDHIFGLPGLLSSRANQGGEEKLTLYGPKGLKQFVEVSLRVSESRLKYPLEIVEIEEGIVFKNKQYQVTALHLDHRIESFGYRIEETDHQGELQVEKLQALGVKPGPIYAKIKAGQTVDFEGKILKGPDFVGVPQKGRVVTILGDTRLTENTQKLAQNADVLVHESTFAKAESKLARNYYHSTSHQAAEVAKKAHVGTLYLTHISARYLGRAALELEKEAQEIFPKTKVVKDFDEFSVHLKQKER